MRGDARPDQAPVDVPEVSREQAGLGDRLQQCVAAGPYSAGRQGETVVRIVQPQLWFPLAIFASPLACALDPLNDTGQTQCFDGAGASILCTTALGMAQDAYTGRDVAAANGALTKTGAGEAGFDFTKISAAGIALPASALPGSGAGDWLCTRDNQTGKLWYRPRLSGNWSGVAAAASALNVGAGQCGRSDWRVARTVELNGLVHYGAITRNPSVDSTYFPASSINESAPITWAAESYIVDANLGYAVVFNGGSSGVQNKSLSHGALAVSGPLPAAPNLVPQGDGSVLDARSGLIFTQCNLGQTAVGANCSGTALSYTWVNAVAEVALRNGSNYLGHDDWRLPNAKEITSISVVPTQFVSTVRAWSSTNYPSFQTSAVAVDLAYGFTTDFPKTSVAFVRLVRAGDPFAGYSAEPGLFRNGFEG